MIERLTTALRSLAYGSTTWPSEQGRRLLADCADAIRLELDCPQQELTSGQRAALIALGDTIDESTDPTVVRDAARTASRSLGVAPPIEFRRATNADCATAQHIVHDALADHGLGILLDTSDKDLRDLEGHYDARGGAFELIFVAGRDEPIGVLGWRPGENGTVELKKVYLRRSARGLGVGRIAVERVIDRARAMGASAVVLETAHTMTGAIRLYTQLGFRPVTGADAAAFAQLGDDCEQAFRLELR